MPADAALVCIACHRTYSPKQPRWKCDCGGLLDIQFTPAFKPDLVRHRKPTMWRYREAIPIFGDQNIVTFDEGFTPLLEADVEGHRVWIKQDHLFQTGSYKDRGASVLISQARAIGVKSVVEDSSGNAGCAIAAYCARAGIRCSIFVPADTAAAKLAQIRHYCADLHLIPGSRQQTADAVLTAAQTTYYASHSWNPYFFQGTKTFAYEVCEQLGWKAPDAVVLPVGNGTLLLGVDIGFTELLEVGIVQQRPRIIAVQSENCAPLYHAFKHNLPDIADIPTQSTLAEGIAITKPIRARQILSAIRRSGGQIIAVSDDQIIRSLKDFCRRGFYIEPTSAATIAGLVKYVGECQSDEMIVSVFTGHGMKNTEKMMQL